jgi:Protein of unknown function (DUF2892)
MFKTNVGVVDRLLRIVVGITLIALILLGTIAGWGCVRVVQLLTAAMAGCPLYTVLGVNSCGVKEG